MERPPFRYDQRMYSYLVSIPEDNKANRKRVNLLSIFLTLSVCLKSWSATPPGQPTNLSAVVAGSGQVSLSWAAPSSNGGSAITSYVVRQSSDNGKTWNANMNLNTTSLFVRLIGGFTNGTSYTFQVAALNTIGTGAYSNSSQPLLMGSVPDAPTGVTGNPGNGQVTLSWSAPTITGGSAISGYIINYSPDGGFSWFTPVRTGSSSTGFTLAGLSNGTSYVFKIQAVNAIGAGSLSSLSPSVTPFTVPGAPINITVTPGNGQVTLSWTAPSNNGGRTITNYYYQYSSNNGINWSTPSLTSSSSSSTVTGLTNGTSYLFKVAAVNAAGTGSYSGNSARIMPSEIIGLNRLFAQPIIDTAQTNILDMPWWNPGRPNTPFGYFFTNDHPGSPHPDRVFYVTINNPTLNFNPPTTRSKESFGMFSGDLKNITGFTSANLSRSQFSLSKVDYNDWTLNGVQVENDTIGFWSSTKSFLPDCAPAGQECTKRGQFVMAASYNFGWYDNESLRPKPWQSGVGKGVMVSVDMKVPMASAMNEIDSRTALWKSAAFVNANFLLRDITTKKEFWYSESIFDYRRTLPDFFLNLVMKDECPNGLCLNIPIVLSSIARTRGELPSYSRTLNESSLSPTGIWNDSYRHFSFVIEKGHLQKALQDVGWSTDPGNIEIEHFNLSPELSRGIDDSATIGMSFKNLTVYEMLENCTPKQVSNAQACRGMRITNGTWESYSGTQTRTCDSNGRWGPLTNCQ